MKNNSTSKYKGVRKRKNLKKWSARINYKGVEYHLGYYDYEAEAAKAYDNRAKELFGEFAYLNFM